MSLSFWDQGRRLRQAWFQRPAEMFAALSAIIFVGLGAIVIIPPATEILNTPEHIAAPLEVRFDVCRGQTRVNCVVDGDTIWLAAEKIRIADIDTPEVFSPSCAAERARGERASQRLLQLLNAGPIEVVSSGSRDEDRYGRKLRVILRDGHSLGDTLIAEGLAHRWGGMQRGWCGA